MSMGLFHVGHLLQGMGPEVRVICTPSESLLKKKSFLCQLEIASGLVIGVL
jgi:hypothetical protein